LMPRVHQMRTDLAQFYQSRKPSIRLQYITSTEEKVNFQINGTDLLSRDLNIFATTKANHRAVLEKMKELVITNNTSGASIYDLGNVMKADSLAEVTHVLKAAEKKADAIRQEEMQNAEKLKQMDTERAIQEKQMELDHETMEAEKDRRKDVLVAEIKASGYGAMQDIDQNQQSDFQDSMERIKNSEEFNATMNLNQQKENNRNRIANDKQQLAREKMQTDLSMKQTDLRIAQENKTKSELIAAKKIKDDRKKKK